MNHIENMNEQQMLALLIKVSDICEIGQLARTRDTIIANIENAVRRSKCLGAIEAYHVVIVNDDDGEPMEDQLLNWGEDPEQYIKTYKAVIGA